MEENTGQTPPPDTFVLFDNMAYACTSIKTFDVAEYLLTQLEPIDIEDLDSDNRSCVICQEKFRVSEHQKHSHTPVRTPCGHIFGQKCIMRWLQALNSWGLEEEYEDIPEQSVRLEEEGNTSCPVCRTEFFPPFQTESLVRLMQRLMLWDMALSSAEVEISDYEQHTRQILWEYVDYCESMDELEHDRQRADLHATRAFARWIKALKTLDLTDRQMYLRVKLKDFYRSLPEGT